MNVIPFNLCTLALCRFLQHDNLLCRWNAARAFATYLDGHPELYRDRCVLELGAGGGLPSIVTIKNGARHVSLFSVSAISSSHALSPKLYGHSVIQKLQVTLTDYPDSALITNLEYNVAKNIPSDKRRRVDIQVMIVFVTLPCGPPDYPRDISGVTLYSRYWTPFRVIQKTPLGSM